MRTFAYVKPDNLQQAGSFLSDHAGQAAILAGGTELLIDMKSGHKSPTILVDIKHIPELQEISLQADGGLSIGAAATLSRIAQDNDVKRHFSGLMETCLDCGSWQFRNRATLAGLLCSTAATADLPPVLLCYDALVTFWTPEGARSQPLTELMANGCGSITDSGGIITHISLPAAETIVLARERLRPGRAATGTLVSVTVSVRQGDREGLVWRIAIAGKDTAPTRVYPAEDFLQDQTLDAESIERAARLVEQYSTGSGNGGDLGAYQKSMFSVLTRRSLMRVNRQVGGNS